MRHAFARRLLASSALAFCVSGCAVDDDPSRLTTEVPSGGYALFRVHAGASKRVAFVVELRDVEDAELVLLYSRTEPSSTGWFEIDPRAFAPCRSYGPEGEPELDAGCIVPGGHGAVVDVAVAEGSPQTILRHELVETRGWYAVMRVGEDGPPIPIAVEVSSLDDVEPSTPPTIERVD